jgi:hypothetical protein
MVTAMQRKTKLGLALLGSVLALSLCLMSGPASAQAGISTYCGGWLGVSNFCFGASRQLYEVYGWGDQGGVCVAVWGHSTINCAKNANQGVYSGTGQGYNVDASPYIHNYYNGNNFVHGLAGTY